MWLPHVMQFMEKRKLKGLDNADDCVNEEKHLEGCIEFRPLREGEW